MADAASELCYFYPHRRLNNNVQRAASEHQSAVPVSRVPSKRGSCVFPAMSSPASSAPGPESPPGRLAPRAPLLGSPGATTTPQS
ncbi:hypothetical protein NDU88_005724 [Pleurodeles waltl]|uniref:Uncharacterized protein n=1 Tax=Pleurodeles waltl TaxID=8319 RepID=A0AAV7TBV9_PLEWA|nr:hypothetical protein NDU88_005724 [Pleurodeles waltl]